MATIYEQIIPKKVLNMKTKRKIQKRKSKIKMETTNAETHHTVR
jgi:hypothetical protein